MFCYNVGYHRTYNATAILLQLPSFDALLHNYRCSFSKQWSCVDNAVVRYFTSSGMCLSCGLLRYYCLVCSPCGHVFVLSNV